MNFGVSLLSLFVCLMVASLLARTQAFAFLENRSARFEALDGLRGFMALSVLFHHFVITYYWKLSEQWVSPPENFYQNYGQVGVAVFFMITGFLFLSKILREKDNIDWYRVFESRIFRIFPLYFFVVILVTLNVFHNSDYRLNSSAYGLLKEYVRWGVFHGSTISGFRDTRLIIAGVDWTLKYEWLFYFSLPILAYLLCKGGKVIGFLILVLTISFFFYPVFLLSFMTKYFILFAVGGVAAYIVKYQSVPASLMESKLVSTVALLLFIGSIFYPETLSFIHVLLISVFFVLVVLGNDLYGILRLRSAILLGEISYSVYLLHGLVLYILFTQFSIVDISNFPVDYYSLFMPLVSVLVVLLSSVTFLFIERPFMNYGRKYVLARFFRSSFSSFSRVS